MSPLQTTNAEIRRRLQHEALRREERRRAELPMRTIDRLLADLEELHLTGRKRVPETYDRRLEELTATLPEACRTELRSRITIAHLMDRLYAIQGRLLRHRAGRRGWDGDDEDDFLSRAS
jgi:hypothetical protein